jgi:branched-chain amino acid aminotransferase
METLTEQIQTTKNLNTRFNDINWGNLKFGVYFSDHIFISEFKNGKWDSGKIEPYTEKGYEPALCTLHYGQTIFEGLKAFRDVNGGVNIFRPDKNAKRLNISASKVCIPQMDEELIVRGIKQLVTLDNKFIPKKRGESLYIRPVVFGTGNFLGVSASDEYQCIIITSPVASYYAEGLNPVKIMVETEFVRAVRGGLGTAKTAANYAASLLANKKAHEKGYSQVLWLDAISREYIDEVGAMNIMFVIDDELITPTLDQQSILAGITRESVLTLGKEFGMKVTERKISINEVVDAHKKGKLQEIFGTGTAAVISPVGLLSYNGMEMKLNDMKIGPVAQKFYDTISGIQYGEIEDLHNWNLHIDI